VYTIFGYVKINVISLQSENETLTESNIVNMITIQITLQEKWMACRPLIQKSKKVYNRKPKHKKVYK
jgi:hypothetical protein